MEEKMKPKNTRFRLPTLARASMLLLASFVVVTAFSAFAPHNFFHSDLWLFNKAREFRGKQDYVEAVAYLTAYIERDTKEYTTNKNHKSDVDINRAEYLKQVRIGLRNGSIAVDYANIINQCLADNNIKDRIIFSTASTPGMLPPAPDQVLLFADSNFQGQYIVNNIGRVDWIENAGLGNDVLSSVMVGDHVKLIVCTDINMGPPCTTFTQDDSNLNNDAVGDNNASSFEVVR